MSFLRFAGYWGKLTVNIEIQVHKKGTTQNRVMPLKKGYSFLIRSPLPEGPWPPLMPFPPEVC